MQVREAANGFTVVLHPMIGKQPLALPFERLVLAGDPMLS